MTQPITRLESHLADRYRIERELGQGGMATVYLAEDIRHHRKVAIKVLRPELSAVLGPERFLKEIELTANLQHPHILPLFDSGSADGLLYYVMPYVEGESLRQRLMREKQLPVGEAIRLAREVVSALDYAHRHNVVHRDVKPENILLHDRSALVADFGIALAVEQAGGARMTQTGISLGTPQYMSPEQALGERAVDARADIYALGAVTYEMLAGDPPFTGPNAQAIVAQVLTTDPTPLAVKRRSVPPQVEQAVLTALAKLPADRFESAAEFAAALETGVPSAVAARAQNARRLAEPLRRVPMWVPWAVAGAMAVAAVWGWLPWRASSPELPPSRLAIVAPGLRSSSGSTPERQLALTPDGTTLVFVAAGADGASQLVRRSLDATEPTPIVGALPGLSNPTVSADGRWLIAGIPGERELFRYPLEGGTGVRLPQEVATSFAMAWAPDGSLWFSPGTGVARGFARLEPSGSVTWWFPEHVQGLIGLIQQILPDGRTMLVVRRPLGTNFGPALLVDLGSGEQTQLLDFPVLEIRYTSGYLLYVLPDGALYAMAFDPRRRGVSGAGVPIATDVSISGAGIAQFAVAPTGTVAYIPEEPRSLVFVDRGGGVQPVIAQRQNFHAPQFSPDGRRLALDFTTPDGRDVWMLSLDQGTLTRVTFDRDGHDPTWTPDGRFITYSSVKGGPLGIYRTRPGSGAPPESLFASPKLGYSGSWLRDGSALVTTGVELRQGSGSDIAIVRNEGRGPIEPLVATQFAEAYPVPSPDGRWLAFVSDHSGQQQVYVRPLEGEGDQVLVSLTGGTEPVWSPDGRELFYRGITATGADLIAAQLRAEPRFEVVSRRTLFPLSEMVGSAPHANYDISPDGRTFVMVRRSPPTKIMIIQNLPALVARLLGASNPR